MYSEDKPYTIYHQDEWWSDRWDPISYGIDYNFSRPFFEQVKELSLKVPRLSLYNKGSENSEYTNYSNYNKNCYLVFGGWQGEDLLYCYSATDNCKNSIDCTWIQGCVDCYENIDCKNNYHVLFAQNTQNSSDSAFLYDCNNCVNCYFCTNIENKENYLFNKPSTTRELEKVKNYLTTQGGIKQAIEKFETFLQREGIHKYYSGENNENSTGNYLYGSKNVKESYSVFESENIRYAFRIMKQTSSQDVEGCGFGSFTYDSMSTDFSHNVLWCMTSEHLTNSFYTDHCYHGKYLFGCIGLRHKEYCILNKQYTKEEYEKLLPQIIAHMQETEEWGNFFPNTHSPFAYNETVANEYFPLTRNEVMQHGWKWHTDTLNRVVTADGKNILQREQIPDKITNTSQEYLKKIFLCEVTNKPFKITPQEYAFYLKYNIPLPRLHPDQRHLIRLKKRNPKKLWSRVCFSCNKECKSSYSPDQTEKIYCEECYQKAMY